VFKPDVCPDENPLRLRQHGTFDLFSQKICTLCKFFVKKDGFFRPVGGEISCRVNDRVSRVTNTTYAVGSSNRTFHPVNGRIACGSMVFVYLFQEHVARRATCS
jgi:hypothetical protein